MPEKTHLSFDARITIQDLLDAGASFTAISNVIGKHRTTIAREVRQYRIEKMPLSSGYRGVLCKRRHDCPTKDYCQHNNNCTAYEPDTCPNTEKAPFVCNSCEKGFYCRFPRYYYSAIAAQNKSDYILSDSRKGIYLSEAEADEIQKVIKPLIVDKKQSVNQVYQNHSDLLYFSKATFYKYVNIGAIGLKNIDLPRKVRYKPRHTQKYIEPTNRAVRMGRDYASYQRYVNDNPNFSIVQMDTVIGLSGSKSTGCFLTLLFTSCNLMLIRYMQYKRTDCVTKQFVALRQMLGEDKYHQLFKVILTDNGSEFMDPRSIEVNYETGTFDTKLFYTDPYSAWQKGALEKNHEYIRFVVPKGKSLAGLTQEKCDLLASHINSVPRDSLGGKTPYQLAALIIGEDTLSKLGIKKIKEDDVSLSPSLIK